MPRTFTTTTTVYRFSELSDSAKERARDWYRSCMDSSDYYLDEYVDSLKAFCRDIGIRLDDYELGGYRPSPIRFTFDPASHYGWDEYNYDLPELSGVRLWKWIKNGHFAYTEEEIRDNAAGACKLTGVCTDCPLFDELRDFLDRPGNYTLTELLRFTFDRFQKAVEQEIEYRNSDEQIDESILANGYEFTIDGEQV